MWHSSLELGTLDNSRNVYKFYFMLLFDLTPDRAESEGHTSYPDNGNVRIELKFAEALTDAITYLIYLEHDRTLPIENKRVLTTDY